MTTPNRIYTHPHTNLNSTNVCSYINVCTNKIQVSKTLTFTIYGTIKQKTPIYTYQKAKTKNTHLQLSKNKNKKHPFTHFSCFIFTQYKHIQIIHEWNPRSETERKKENPRWGIWVGISGTVLDGSWRSSDPFLLCTSRFLHISLSLFLSLWLCLCVCLCFYFCVCVCVMNNLGTILKIRLYIYIYIFFTKKIRL